MKRIIQILTLTTGLALTGPLAGGAELSRSDRLAVARVQNVLARHFAQPFAEHVSAHFVVLHNAGDEDAAARAELLEWTHRRFYEAFGEAGFRVRPLRRRMTCILFADQADFARYALEVDRLNMGWSGGYYSSRTNHVALFEGPTRPPVADDDAAPTSSDSASASATPAFSLASTTHEAAHQLAFNSGLQRRGVMYPLWAAEGLATQFERERPGQPIGPEHLNPTRHRDLRRGWLRGRLLPLDEMAVLTRVPTQDPAQVDTVYAQAWGLFRFLFLHQREALADYLDTLAGLERGERAPAVLRAEFVAAFGPIADLERSWQQHLARTLP